MSQKGKLPLIIAHRGARREAPENTMPAFRRAVEAGVKGIELDVLLTSDKVPIVTHYDDLSVLTTHKGFVRATPFSVVRSLDFGSHFSAQTKGVTCPALTEVIEFIKELDILTIVEIKPQRGGESLAARVVGGIASDFRLRGPIMISSSSRKIVHELKRSHPEIPRALILKKPPFSLFFTQMTAKFLGLAAVHPSLGALTAGLVERIHSRGMEIHAWTANDASSLDRCVSLGIDGIITDDVAFAMKHLEPILKPSRAPQGQGGPGPQNRSVHAST